MNIKRTIIIAAKDAGGCNALLPVVKKLRKIYQIMVIADYPAYDMFTRDNIRLDIFKSYLSKAELDAIFKERTPDLVLVGTSWKRSIEDSIVEGARRHNIPSVGILDSCLRYDERFASNSNRWFYLPSYLIVMNNIVKRDMIKLGAPAKRIFSMGNPFFDNVIKEANTFRRGVRKTDKKHMGKTILFLSEPNSFFNKNTGSVATSKLGYDEFKVLEDLSGIIKRIENRKKTKIEFIIKPHPLEKDISKFTKFIDANKAKVVDNNLYKLMLDSDLVIGMQSMGLMQACMIGVVNLSYQPALQVKDMLLTNRLRIGQFCYSNASCEKKIEKLLFDKAGKKTAVEKMKKFKVPKGATESIVKFVCSIIDRLQIKT